MSQPVLLVGAGRIGGALLKGWIAGDIGPIGVVEPRPSSDLRKLARLHGIPLWEKIERLATPPRACVIALKPQVLRIEAGQLKAVAQSGALMVSVAAGTTIALLCGVWGRKARIIRAMPNTPGRIGQGISALYAGRGTTSQDRRLAEALLTALGETLWVRRETLIDAVTAVSGSGPAYVFLLVEALAEAACAEGLPRSDAEKLARATVAGAGALLRVDKRSAAELRKEVTSPGGTTEAALKILLRANGIRSLIGRAVHAAKMRAEDIGR